MKKIILFAAILSLAIAARCQDVRQVVMYSTSTNLNSRNMALQELQLGIELNRKPLAFMCGFSTTDVSFLRKRFKDIERNYVLFHMAEPGDRCVTPVATLMYRITDGQVKQYISYMQGIFGNMSANYRIFVTTVNCLELGAVAGWSNYAMWNVGLSARISLNLKK